MEILFVVCLAGGMIGSGVYIGMMTKRWHLLYVFLTFFGIFGFWEWNAVETTGMTMSQQVWEFGELHPTGFWVVMAALLISWIALLVHFAAKKIGK